MMREIGVSSDRVVLHMDMDTFFVSVERLLNRGLKGRPVLVGGLGERSVVSSCSYEARRYGVHSAMPMKLARRLCPDAVVLSGDMETYSRYSHMVTDIIREQVPVFEKASVDEFYLDLTGMDRFFSCVKWSKELRMRIIRETGLPVSWGLSSNKMVSKIATGEAKPNGEREIIRGGESAFISPMSVSKIPMIGEKTSQSLRQMGVSKVYELREIPEDVLRRMFGETGAELWRRSRGIDFSPVEPYFEQKSVSKERTLQEDTTNPSFLRDVLTVLTERLCYELRGKQKLCSVVTVKLRYSNFDTSTLQERIGYTACDHSLLEKVLRLFERLYDRRLLVRLVGVRFSGLVHGVDQIRLFDETEQRVHLYRAIDKLKDKYGEDSIGRAVGLGLSMRRDPSANSELILPQVV